VKSLGRKEVRDELQARIERLRPESRALWGRMNAAQMICHASDQLRVALGDISAERLGSVARFWPLKMLVVYVLRPPKGRVRTVKEMQQTRPTAWQADVAVLFDLVRRFGERDRNGAWPDHPAFGKMSGRAWASLTYRHLDHHLRQFGV
jgi:hypothetical protein